MPNVVYFFLALGAVCSKFWRITLSGSMLWRLFQRSRKLTSARNIPRLLNRIDTSGPVIFASKIRVILLLQQRRLVFIFVLSWLTRIAPLIQCPKPLTRGKPSITWFPNPLKNRREIQCQSTSLLFLPRQCPKCFFFAGPGPGPDAWSPFPHLCITPAYWWKNQENIRVSTIVKILTLRRIYPLFSIESLRGKSPESLIQTAFQRIIGVYPKVIPTGLTPWKGQFLRQNRFKNEKKLLLWKG